LGASPVFLRYAFSENRYLQREFGSYTAHHLPLPKTSDTIQHDIENREKPLQIQGFIV
jgi:hypothetical protein